MGKNYEYRLYFWREQIEEVVAAIQNTASFFYEAQATATTRFYQSSLFFDTDEFIQQYVEEDWNQGVECQRRVSPVTVHEQVAVGNIKIYLYLSSSYNPHLVEFHFAAVTTGLSYLFEQSPSIRQAFVQLLLDHKGVCALFEDSDHYWFATQVLWPPNQEWQEGEWNFMRQIVPCQTNSINNSGF